MKILVVGAGSIGTRHRDNLEALGAEVATSDLNPVRKSDYTNLHTAIKDFHPDAAVVAVPTHLHMDVAIEVASHNMPLFIEKPVSHTMNGIDVLQRMLKVTGQWAVVGYSLRFHPALQIIKELLPRIGTPLYARAEVGQYLPDWHPTEDYTKWYMAHEDQGGGALLDLSHEIDYMRWMFGDISEAQGYVGKVSNLEMDADDLADIQTHHENLPLGSIHMDLLDRSYNRRLRIVGSDATIAWEWDRSITLKAGEFIEYSAYKPDRNIQFIKEMEAFVKGVKSGIPHPTMATLDDGIEVLKTVLELKEQNGR